MELNRTTRLKQSGQAARREAKQEAGGQGKSAVRQSQGADRLTLSRQVAAIVEEHNRRIAEARQAAQKKEYAGAGESSGEANILDAMNKRLKAALKCQKIAARIMAGDHVPPEDRRYLENSDPDGYKLALAMRKPKKDPKEWESVLDDEDRNGGTDRVSETSAAPTAVADSGE